MTGRVRFVILTTQRSGSNWMEDRLDTHPQIDMKRSEVFRRSLDSADAYQTFRRRSRATYLAAYVTPAIVKRQYLHWLCSSTDADAVGLRLMYDQLRSNPSLALLLPAKGFRVVHLIRENVLATLLSITTVGHTGVYLRRRPVEQGSSTHLAVDGLVNELRRRQRTIDRHRRLLRRTHHLEVFYERYQRDAAATDAMVSKFLDVDAGVELGSGWVRGNTAPLRDRIANAEEVAEALAGTEFEWCLTEDRDEDQAQEA